MKIVHISDTHGSKWHNKLDIPECDVLIHSGDIGGRTNVYELTEFLVWFERQPAKKKVWIAGNHDLILDNDWVRRKKKDLDSVAAIILEQQYNDAQRLLTTYNTTYLFSSGFEYEGVKFWGSAITPSFHREHWAFNKDRGEEISKEWSKIPSDTDVLITHGPPYGLLDSISEKYKSYPEEDIHRGCEDLFGVIKKRLLKLKLHCFGHIHENTGLVQVSVSQSRRVWFSNGAIMTNGGDMVYPKPFIINL